jgi:hypothetical protein
MTDLIDRAEDEIEMELAEALRRRQPAGPPAIGACHYCAEPLAGELRWCGAECERGWEFEQERRRQNAE